MTEKKAGPTPPEHIVAQNNLQRALLIRFLSDGRRQYFILEDVATRKRQRFDSKETLLAWLKNIFPE